MGTFHSTIAIAAAPAGPFEPIEALVDSGAPHTLVPETTLRRLSVRPIDGQTFMLADGSRVGRDVGEAVIRIEGRTRTSVVIFGDEGAEPRLGAVTLEEFGLGIDTLRRELVPVPGYLVGIRLEDANDS